MILACTCWRLQARREFGSAGEIRYCGHGSVTLYFSSGYMASLRGMPSSSRMGSSSWRYSSYWFLFSTLNLTPVGRVSNQTGLNGCSQIQSTRSETCAFAELWHALAQDNSVFGGSRTLENSDGRGEVVNTPGSAESGGDDGGRRDKIVGEAVVQVSLRNIQLYALACSASRAHPSGSGDAGGGRGVASERRT
jgi:hypothetical protein